MNLSSENPPAAKIQLLIRRPIDVVFNAFVNPDEITRFWFNRSSGALEKGQQVIWYWDRFGASSKVNVLELDDRRRILIDWDVDTDSPTTVEWMFEQRGDTTTYVSITQTGFPGNGEEVLQQVVDSTGGFTLVLAAAKAWLEHGINLNIVNDRF